MKTITVAKFLCKCCYRNTLLCPLRLGRSWYRSHVGFLFTNHLRRCCHLSRSFFRGHGVHLLNILLCKDYLRPTQMHLVQISCHYDTLPHTSWPCHSNLQVTSIYHDLAFYPVRIDQYSSLQRPICTLLYHEAFRLHTLQYTNHQKQKNLCLIHVLSTFSTSPHTCHH